MTRRGERLAERDQAHGAAGAIAARAQIDTAIGWLTEHVGEGVLMAARWDRTGSQEFPLIGGDRSTWTTRNLFGNSGRFEVSAIGAKRWPVQAAGFAYRLSAGAIVIDPDPLTFNLPDDWLSPASASFGAAAESQPAGVDPISLGLTIFSVLRAIWGILHPTCDLLLGGNVSATATLNGGELLVDFTQAPQIKLVAYWTFLLGVKLVRLSPSKVHVEFIEQPGAWFPIRSRDFEVV